MAKRKKTKAGKRSSRARKGSGRKAEKLGRAPMIESALFTAPDPPPPFTTPPRVYMPERPAALTPKPALPVSERGKRERQTRGGKTTLPTHELLAEIPAPPQVKPPAPQAKAPPKAPAKPTTRPATKPTARPASRATPPPARPKTPPQHAPQHGPDAGQPLSMAQIYETLAALLVPYARKMESEMHPKIGFCLKAKSARTGRETHFGAVQALPDGVAYHLFPLYGHPDLLENLSPDLFNRLRGKTCFHFESLHAGLVAELAQLTHAGFERFLADGVF